MSMNLLTHLKLYSIAKRKIITTVVFMYSLFNLHTNYIMAQGYYPGYNAAPSYYPTAPSTYPTAPSTRPMNGPIPIMPPMPPLTASSHLPPAPMVTSSADLNSINKAYNQHNLTMMTENPMNSVETLTSTDLTVANDKLTHQYEGTIMQEEQSAQSQRNEQEDQAVAAQAAAQQQARMSRVMRSH